MDTIDKLGWICIKDRKVLSARSKTAELFFVPGGKREPGESDEQALCREIEEELAVALVPTSLKYLEVFEAQAHGKPEGVMVRITCYTGDYVGEVKPTSEIAELAWFDSSDKAKISLITVIIFDWLKQRDLID